MGLFSLPDDLSMEGSLFLKNSCACNGDSTATRASGDVVTMSSTAAMWLYILAGFGFIFLHWLNFNFICWMLERPWDGSIRDHHNFLHNVPFVFYYIGSYLRSWYVWLADIIPAPIRVVEMSTTFVQSQVVFTLVNLGVADALAQAGPCTAKKLAKLCGVASPLWLGRVMRAAEALRLVSSRKMKLPGESKEVTVYFNNGITSCLRSDHPSSVCNLVRLNEYNYANAAYITQAVKKGTSAQELRAGQSFWTELLADPKRAAVFDAAMTGAFECMGASMVTSGFPWGKYSYVIDVAGGIGSFLQPLLSRYPQLQGMVMDQKEQVERGVAHWTANHPRLMSRAAFVAGDMFDATTIPEPPAGVEGRVAYCLKDILHNWDDEAAVNILKSVAAAMKRSEKAVAAGKVSLLIVETSVCSDHMAPFYQPRTTADVVMMANFGSGCERDKQEFEALFLASGFKLRRIVPTKGMYLVLEAVLE